MTILRTTEDVYARLGAADYYKSNSKNFYIYLYFYYKITASAQPQGLPGGAAPPLGAARLNMAQRL